MKNTVPFLGLCLLALVASAQDAGAPARKTGDTAVITLPGGATMEMIWCAPGKFTMGSPPSEKGRFDDETRHEVSITKGFWLGKYEVTQRQWESVMRSNPSRFRGPDNPVENISWHDCDMFVRKANAVLGGLARLPTEAEWEYAFRPRPSGSTPAEPAATSPWPAAATCRTWPGTT